MTTTNATPMASRIFVSGLPPSLTQHEFEKHFARQGAITDTKLFPKRRIGYVGFKSPEEAAKAVKYFNRSFIRMSKLSVELAKPIESKQEPVTAGPGPTNDADISKKEGGTLKRKRASADVVDPKLQEYLAVMQKRSRNTVPSEQNAIVQADVEASDEDIQFISSSTQSKARDLEGSVREDDVPVEGERDSNVLQHDEAGEPPQNHPNTSLKADDDWLRSRTSRLLDLEDDEGSMHHKSTSEVPKMDTRASANLTGSDLLVKNNSGNGDATSAQRSDGVKDDAQPRVSPLQAGIEDDIETRIRASHRLYLRNLSYDLKAHELEQVFQPYGTVSEVHLPLDRKSGQTKGFAFVLFDTGEDAVKAWKSLDGTPLNGRLVHILPAVNKKETRLDDFELSKLPLKKQEQIKKRRDAASKTFSWNSLYMNQDAILSSVADKLGVSKSAILDPTSADAAVKQAHAETHVIQETKQYFRSHGINLHSFSHKKRGDTVILVKNFPFDVKASDLRSLFEQHGNVERLLIPPSGTIAIVELGNAAQAKAAFSALAYTRIKNSMLYLEFAPHDLFEGLEGSSVGKAQPQSTAKTNANDLLADDSIPDDLPTATLYVRNLNFSTTTKRLDEVFRPLDGFMSARVKTKTDPKKPGQVLSMGFGFLEFRSKEQAQKALLAMDGYMLDGHDLQIRASHKGRDAAEEQKRTDKAKRDAAKRAKLVIKNLPFEASKKDVRSLLGAYGQLRSVRVPKKIGQSTRGFAFAEFTNPKEAANARDALLNTHLLGRRLVIDYAAEDIEDAEEAIEKMQSKVGSQLNKVAVQNLLGEGRKKFSVNDQGAEEAE